MPLSLHRVLFSLLLSFILSAYLSAQPSGSADPKKDSLTRYIQMKYGLDQELFNGFQYYKRYVKYKGDPFFPEDVFYDGSVTVKGVEYEHVRLKYNSYSQFLVLEYTDFNGRYNQLRISSIHIDSFQLGAFGFQKLTLFGEEPLFYQVVSAGNLTCYIHWTKNIHATSDDLQYTYEYTKALGNYYVNNEEGIQSFNNRKTFISIFPDPVQGEINKYFRNQSLSFREAGPDDIQKLIVYLSQLKDTLSEH